MTPMAESLFVAEMGKDQAVTDPASVWAFRDHLTFLDLVMPKKHIEMGLKEQAGSLATVQEAVTKRQGVKLYGELDRLNLHGALSAQGSEAICHSKILEAHAEPGQIIIGSW